MLVRTNVLFDEKTKGKEPPDFWLQTSFSREKAGKLNWSYELDYRPEDGSKPLKWRDHAELASGERRSVKHGKYAAELQLDGP